MSKVVGSGAGKRLYSDFIEMADDMSIDKKEPDREGSDDSMDSTPEAETGAPLENTGQQKRKGGRKPVLLLNHPTLIFADEPLDLCYF